MTRSANKAPTTTEILARRALERAAGRECVDWAIGMLERGYDSKSLRVLAGLIEPLNSFEVGSLRDRALDELRLPELTIEDPVSAYVAEMVSEALADKGALRDVFARVAALASQLGYPSHLWVFYRLHFAADDLLHSEEQHYWDGATKENIDDIMLAEVQRYVATYGV